MSRWLKFSGVWDRAVLVLHGACKRGHPPHASARSAETWGSLAAARASPPQATPGRHTWLCPALSLLLARLPGPSALFTPELHLDPSQREEAGERDTSAMPDPDFHHPPSYPSARRWTRPGRCSWRGQSVGTSVAEAPHHLSRRSQPRFPVQLPFWAPLTNWTLFSKLAGETFLPCWNHFQSYIGKPEAAGQLDSWPVNKVHWGEIGFMWRAVYAEGVEVDGEESMNIRN